MGIYKRCTRMLCYGSTKRIAGRKEKKEQLREAYVSRDLDIRSHLLGSGTVSPLPDVRGERTIGSCWSNVDSAPSDEHRRSHRRSHLSRRVTSNSAAELARFIRQRDGVDASETTSSTVERRQMEDVDDLTYACGDESYACHPIADLLTGDLANNDLFSKFDNVGPNDHVSVYIYLYIYIYIHIIYIYIYIYYI